jgi:hypothetical protein
LHESKLRRGCTGSGFQVQGTVAIAGHFTELSQLAGQRSCQNVIQFSNLQGIFGERLHFFVAKHEISYIFYGNVLRHW